MKRSGKYAEIKTLSQLREERFKLQSEITTREIMLNLHYSELKESLSITRFLSNLFTKISVIMPMFQMAKKLYRSVIDMFRGEEAVLEEESEQQGEVKNSGDSSESKVSTSKKPQKSKLKKSKI
ncbi:MAG: hypothetical protein CVU13_00220 [Bacteroidetes bacterium HGW-Bacteroidetes-8]|jgi:hypothetical protein|nr:MAG: hypothetical protein CVU13_00220 [Bacteroidetes bacterium HGW-Bacteroidetes-8]